MFTGIIEELGQVESLNKLSSGADLKIKCKNVLSETKIGDSISVNGACQTVVAIGDNSFTVNISEETLKITNLKMLKPNQIVNLERALRLSDRLSGHLVSGHVEAMVKFLSKEKLGEFYNMTFEISQDLKKYIIKKGSVTINGISLTVASLGEKTLTCAVIPHTFQNTNLKELNNGDIVNIETDMIAKYVENFVIKENKKPITRGFLEENGFV